jgi:hypothetical protein
MLALVLLGETNLLFLTFTLFCSDKSKNITIIDGFYWSITYQNLHNFLDVQQLMRIRREIIAKYANDFNVTSHHPLEKVPAESAASAPDNFIQTSGL